MNRLKQHLNDSLQELEMTPALQAEIFMKTEKPAARKHGRVAVAALLVMCMVGITAVAAVVSTGWTWDPTDLRTVVMEPATYGRLPKKTLDYLSDLIAADQREIGFDSFEAFEETMGFPLLRAEGMQLVDARVDKTEPKSLINVHIGGLDVSSAQLWITYSGDIRDDKGNFGGRLVVPAAVVDLSAAPQQVPHHYEGRNMAEATLSQYEIQALGVTADLLSWADRMSVDTYFTYEGVTYQIFVASGGRVAYPPAAVSRACAILETLHD